jgi:hypothetical protein
MTLNLYVNGFEVSPDDRSANITIQTTDAEPVHLGASYANGSMNTFYKGKIDEARIFSGY